MDYLLGKQIEEINVKLDYIIENIKIIGDMIYENSKEVKKEKPKRRFRKSKDENEEEDITNIGVE